MIESATGLVLRTRPLTETSLIVHWLTPGLGRVSTVAKGARRLKSPFLGRLDLFYLADFSFNRRRHSDLHLLREVRLRATHPALREDLSRLRPAIYAAALIEQTTETETPLPVFFNLLQGFLEQLDRHPASPQLVFSLELKLLQELGLTPVFEKTGLTAGTAQIGRTLLAGDWQAGGRLRLSLAQVDELKQFLRRFMMIQLGRLPGGRVAALAD